MSKLLGVLLFLWLTSIASATIVYLGPELGESAGFTLLALNDGTMIIDSATSIVGDVGYSNGVVSNTNQKVDSFTGTVYVHSGATFSDTPATFAPSGGFVIGGAADTHLNHANTDAAAAAAFFAGLAAGPGVAVSSLGSVTGSLNLTSTADVNVFDLTSVNLNSQTWTLNGSATDLFVFRVSGNLDWSQSQTILNGVSANQIVFYFANASSIDINKSPTVFDGTILAPTGSVIYHNPATFNGAIIAENIDVHSDFNIFGGQGGMVQAIPESSTFVLLGTALVGVGLVRPRRKQSGQSFERTHDTSLAA